MGPLSVRSTFTIFVIWGILIGLLSFFNKRFKKFEIAIFGYRSRLVDDPLQCQAMKMLTRNNKSRQRYEP